MLLKLSALLAMLFLSDAGGGAADGDGGDGGSDSGDGASSGDSNDTGGTASGDQSGDQQDRQPSANKLIKDFAKQRGISVEDLITRYQELEDAGKTELEKLNGERDRYKSDAERLTAEIRDLRSESAFVEAARTASARGPKTLFRAYKDQLKFDKAGNPTNVAEVIAKAKTDEPDLFKPTSGTSDAGRPGDSPGGSDGDINTKFRRLRTG